MRKLILLLLMATTSGLLAQQDDYSLLYDGINSRVKYTTDADLDQLNGATDFTIEAWFYPTDADIHNRVIMKRYYQFAITMYQNDNKRIYFTHYSNNGADRIFVNSLYNVVNLNEWNHVAVINNSTDNTLKIYMNGVDVTADVDGNPITQPALTLEANPGSQANFYVGYGNPGTVPYAYIDKVRIKKTAEDIANLNYSDIMMQAYTPDTDTVILMNFNEGSGTTTKNEANNVDAVLECRGGCSELPVWELTAPTMAVQNTVMDHLNVYPNPVQGENLYIAATNNEEILQVEINDLTGKSVLKQAVKNTRLSLPVSSLQKGMYLLKITTPQGTGVQKILIK